MILIKSCFLFPAMMVIHGQKQPSIGFTRKRYSENILQIYSRTPMPKCDFNKVTQATLLKSRSAWLFSSKFAAYFQNTFSLENLWTAASAWCCRYVSVFIRSLIFEKQQSPEVLSKNRCFPVNFKKFLRTPTLKNTSG